jgi:hypothetical protein
MSKEETKTNRVLRAKHIQGAEYARNLHTIIPEEGVTKEDLVNPAYYCHAARDLKPWDRIEVHYRHTDKTYFAELIVMSVLRTAARVHLLRYEELEKIEEGSYDTVDFKVDYGNMHTGFRVIRNSDKVVIKKDFKSKGEAIVWLNINSKSLAA